MAYFFRFSAQKTKMMIFIKRVPLNLTRLINIIPKTINIYFPHHKGTKKS
jgi:hypothetical protein